MPIVREIGGGVNGADLGVPPALYRRLDLEVGRYSPMRERFAASRWTVNCLSAPPRENATPEAMLEICCSRMVVARRPGCL